MIVINSDLLIQNQTDFDMYIEALQDQTYDEWSDMALECIVGYLNDVWERDARLTYKVQQQIDPDIYPLIYVDILDTADLRAIRFGAVSSDKDKKIKKKQKIAFQRYCNKYFKTMVSLFDRFCNL